jgi:protein SCO1/2
MLHKILPILLLALGACATKPHQAASNAPIERYQLDGVVLQLEPPNVAKIKHQEIKGYMEAMTMEFPVKDAVEFAALHVNDHIRATVFVQDLNYWIGEIHQVR